MKNIGSVHATIGKALQQIEGEFVTSKMPRICIVCVMSLIGLPSQYSCSDDEASVTCISGTGTVWLTPNL